MCECVCSKILQCRWVYVPLNGVPFLTVALIDNSNSWRNKQKVGGEIKMLAERSSASVRRNPSARWNDWHVVYPRGGIETLHMRRGTMQKGNRIRQQVQPVSSVEFDQVIDRYIFNFLTTKSTTRNYPTKSFVESCFFLSNHLRKSFVYSWTWN